MLKKEFLVVGGIILVLVLTSFLFLNNSDSAETNELEDTELTEESLDVKEEEKETIDSIWKEATLTNINTGNEFKISDFSDKPILLESFAVWCPICTSQQKEIKKLHDELGDSVISISLDTDPNEDETKVKSHTENNGFDWIYAISHIEVTQSLIDEFGIGFVNAPSAPVVLICPDGTSKKLKTGVKSSSELKTEIEGCS